MPIHIIRLSSAADKLSPLQDLEHIQQFDLQMPESSGFLQQFRTQTVTQELEEQHGEPRPEALHPVTPDTSTATASKKMRS